MSKQVRIKLDFQRLAAHLSRDEGRSLSSEDVLQWLSEAGFTKDGPFWIVSEADLGQVEPSEVLEIESLDESHP